MTNTSFIQKKQAGAALVVSLIFLLVMTILALSMSQTTTLEERMAGNARDSNSAFQGAEAAAAAGQAFLSTTTPSLDSSGVDLSGQSDTWWNNNGTEYGTAAQELTNLTSDPHYVVRSRALHVTHGTLDPASGEHTTSYYEVIGRSHGTTSDSEAVTSVVVAIPD